jgi:hypothetical protein
MGKSYSIFKIKKQIQNLSKKGIGHLKDPVLDIGDNIKRSLRERV